MQETFLLCNSIAVTQTAIYGAAAVISLLLLIGYFGIARKKDIWFILLFSSVLVVNIGYFCLAISSSLSEALLSNRIAYLGSVLLPMTMLMIILNVINIKYKKWLPWILIGLCAVVFFIAASPGYLDIYYKEVSFEIVDGVATLVKVYGPLHFIYLVYLLGYFGSMVATIIYAVTKKKIDSWAHSVFLAMAVFVNIGIWFIEQITDMNFEMLSISYIISELFLLGVHLIMNENQKLKALAAEKQAAPAPVTAPTIEETGETATYLAGVEKLTPTERIIFDAYIARTTTKEIMEQLNITENTLKFHNKNIYSKLGVSSRKELLEKYKQTAMKKGNE